MKVAILSANIRYSKDVGQGAWKVVELGAEATVDGHGDWQAARSPLYVALGQQLRSLWAVARAVVVLGAKGSRQ